MLIALIYGGPVYSSDSVTDFELDKDANPSMAPRFLSRKGYIRVADILAVDDFPLGKVLVVFEDSEERYSSDEVFQHFTKAWRLPEREGSRAGGAGLLHAQKEQVGKEQVGESLHTLDVAPEWLDFESDYQSVPYAVVTLWAALRIENTQDSEARLVFSNRNLSTGDTTVFYYHNGELREQDAFGLAYTDVERKIRSRYYLHAFDIPAHSHVDMLLRVRVKGANKAVLHASMVSTEEQYLFQDPLNDLLVWLYYGSMLILALLSLIAFLVLKNRAFLFFSLFISGAVFLQVNFDGYGMLYFWPGNAWMMYYSFGLSMTMTFAAFSEFSRDYLDLVNISPRINRLFVGFSVYFVAIEVLAVMISGDVYNLLMFLSSLGFLCMLAVTFSVSIYSWFKSDNVLALVYVLALFSLTCFAVYNIYASFLGEAYQEADRFNFSFSMIFFALTLFVSLTFKIERGHLERDRALAESKAKSDFLAKMSHEIRTPMNGVLGMAELLSDTRLDDNQRYYTRVIYNSGRTLLNVINEILDYSKIAAGKMTFENREFDIYQLGQECSSLFVAQAREKQLELICRIDPHMPHHWQGDDTRIRQIIINLLGNAMKFTDSGEVILDIKPILSNDNKSRLQRGLDKTDLSGVLVEVRDTGVGLTDVQVQNLFQDFVQADNSIARKYGGTGLGLTICKQLVEMMGGEIGLDSRYALGSTFWFTLPLECSDLEGDPLPAHAEDFAGFKILLVDDNRSYREVAGERLRAWGISVDEAVNGEEAMAKIRQAYESGQSYDLLTIDIDMPVMDGIELSKQLGRSDQYLGENKTVGNAVLLSATAHLPSPDDYLSWGVTLAAQKPILADELRFILSKALPQKRITNPSDPQLIDDLPPGQEARTSRVQQSDKSLRILLAEDNDVNFQVASTMLRKMGHVVQRADNGLECLNQFKGNNLSARTECYDLIFMDCEMPGMDGYQATQAIRTIEKERSMTRVPIIALTAHATQDRLSYCKAAGMDDYLSKPIRQKDFESLLKNYT
jgi:signal transduction histidine kinase/CheY-like chemotaxis protein